MSPKPNDWDCDKMRKGHTETKTHREKATSIKRQRLASCSYKPRNTKDSHGHQELEKAGRILP